jgi:hypothetical protein
MTANKTIGVSLIVVLLIAVGAYFYPKYSAPARVGAISASGAYNNAVSLSQATLSLASLTSTSTSILNNGASDRVVESIYASCQGTGIGAGTTGAGTATEILHVATSTLANSTLDNNTNYMFNGTISTTTFSFMASSTGSVQTAAAVGTFATMAPYWPVNSYLNFSVNATNTDVCSFTASWLPL